MEKKKLRLDIMLILWGTFLQQREKKE